MHRPTAATSRLGKRRTSRLNDGCRKRWHTPAPASDPDCPTLLEVSARGSHATTLEDTSHYKLMRAFSSDAHGFVARVLRDEDTDAP